jgi:GNAT superfamily N-acetyltransferase
LYSDPARSYSSGGSHVETSTRTNMTASRRLLPSLDLIHRIRDVDIAYTLSRMRVLERIPGNPIGVAHRRVEDGVVALMARHLPPFNRVVGLRAGHVRHIRPLVEWYREHGAAARFEMLPGDYDAALGRELAQLGYFQSGSHAALIAEPDLDVPAPDGITVEPVESAAAMETFLDVYVAGWGIPDKDRDQFKSNVRPWLGQPGWSLYLARAEGRAGAGATLYVHGGVGYCADAATDPAFRRRGLHAALLARRIRDARMAGAEFTFSGAQFLSASHRNMERAGMRLFFLRSIWTAL